MRGVLGSVTKYLRVDVVAHLETFDHVPPFNEMLDDVKNNGAVDCHVHLHRMLASAKKKLYKPAYVLPWHAGRFQHRNSLAHVIAHVLEVQDARVVVILAGKEGAREICGVGVGKGVILGVPTAKANVKTPNAPAMIIDDNDFLVVRPNLDII